MAENEVQEQVQNTEPAEAGDPIESAVIEDRADLHAVIDSWDDDPLVEDGADPEVESDEGVSDPDAALDAELEDEGDGPRPPEGEQDGAEDGADSEDGAERVFQVVDAEGNLVELDGADDLTFQFKADGAERTASLEEVVQLAQKGVYMDRRTSEWGQERKSFEERVTTLESEVESRDNELTIAEDLLRKVATDDVARAKVREAFEKHDDPEAVARRKAEQEAEQLRREKQERQQRETAEGVKQFWDSAEAAVRDSLVPDHEFLNEEDVEDILQTTHQRYMQAGERLYEQAIQDGKPEDEAVAWATEEALKELSPEAFERTARELNERYRRRLGSRGADPAESANGTDPQAHNRRTERKLNKQRTRRTLRSGGTSAPAPQGSRKKEPVTRDSIFNDLDAEFDTLLEK